MRAKVTSEQIQALRGAVGRTGELSRAELAASARTTCALLAQRFPGGTVELRVPPFAAVQLGQAGEDVRDRGRHTRGTPPNVVQTDPQTLLALASGTLAWGDALASHRVQASGIYSDLSGYWPLPELQPPLAASAGG